MGTAHDTEKPMKLDRTSVAQLAAETVIYLDTTSRPGHLLTARPSDLRSRAARSRAVKARVLAVRKEGWLADIETTAVTRLPGRASTSRKHRCIRTRMTPTSWCSAQRKDQAMNDQTGNLTTLSFLAILALVASVVVPIVGFAQTSNGALYLIAGLLLAIIGVLVLTLRLVLKAVAFQQRGATYTSQVAKR